MTKEYKIGGITVEFPYKAYGPQLAYMSKVVATLEQSRLRPDGKCNALLESPTGSGKSLALLCATLAWQQHYKVLCSKPTPTPEAGSAMPTRDPLVAGGGFIVEDSSTGLESESATRQAEAPRKVPRIFYATRTHAQISQVIREFRKTKYRVRMAILAAKKHYCTNKQVLKKKNVDEDCLTLLRGPPQLPGCRYFGNAAKVRSHPSIRNGGCKDVHDIEDLVKIGREVRGCAYFAAREMAMAAEIVFCPYSYIVDPIIREAVEADIKGSIIIFDEAHNLEDVAREAGSVDLETSVLLELRSELEELCNTEQHEDFYQPLLEMIQDLLGWTEYQSNHLTKSEFERHWSCWTAGKALQELRAAGIAIESFEVLLNFSRKAVSAASDEDKNHLTGRSAKVLEGLFRVLQFMLQNSARRAVDYQLVVQKFVRREKALFGPVWVVCVSLWCLNPAVVFEEISTASRSIIVTSGTLAPVESFASELGVLFDVRIEAPHVVDMETQVWAAAVSVGPSEVVLNASYKNAENFLFQDAVGAALLEIFKVTPDGVLVFFPSYKLLAKLCDRWQSTGLWHVLASQKPLFIEPRVNDDKFESELQAYYRAIKGELPEKKQTLKKSKNTLHALVQESDGKAQTNGAAFLAVCRGKVSEGIDFSDKNARAVVLIGIPFPNVKDIQVSLKKQYNSTYQATKKLLSGDQWYCQQAFRALNQAVGRCIRHRYDYGGIILLDERFTATRNIEYMSKWLRKSIRQFDNFQASMSQLQDFFFRIKELNLGPPGGTPLEEVPQKPLEPPIFGQTKAPSPITPVPITPFNSDSGMLRLSNALELRGTPEALRKFTVDEGPASSSPCLRSGLLPQFDATEPEPTPAFCYGGSSAQQEAPGPSENEIDPKFSTQPRSLYSTPISSPTHEEPGGDVPVFVSGTPFKSMERLKNATGIGRIYSEDDNSTVSLADADGPLYSSMKIEDHVEELLSASVETRCQLDSMSNMGGSKLNTMPCRLDGRDAQSTATHRPNHFSNPTDQNCLESSGRQEAAGTLAGMVSSASGCPTMYCCRCGLQLGSMSSLEISGLQKSYLTTLQNFNKTQGPRVYSPAAVYFTDTSCIGSGRTDGREPKREVSGIKAGNCIIQQSGVWVEEDGCVFKPLVCGRCTEFYVGVHIVAADSKNVALVDKVAIFVESIRIEEEKKSPKGCDERHCCQQSVNLRPISPQSKRTQMAPAGRGKLKLRRTDQRKHAEERF
ncbi:unnamed protein product [Calypogeia fissa]